MPEPLRLGGVLGAVLLGALIALSALAAPAAAESGEILGTAPRPGALRLVVWSGGPVADIHGVAGEHGCEARSVWASQPGGGLVGYIFGAPEIVNRPFLGEYVGGRLPELTPLILVCSPPPSTAASALSADEALMLELINDERARAGLSRLTADLDLSDVARAHSRDMASRDYFGHTNPDGESPFDRMRDAGISYSAAGENLAWAATVRQAHELLMDSPGHRANILNPDFGRIGIGIAIHPDHRLLFTQAFAD